MGQTPALHWGENISMPPRASSWLGFEGLLSTPPSLMCPPPHPKEHISSALGVRSWEGLVQQDGV